MSETTADILWNHIRDKDLCPGAESLTAWRRVRWIRARIAGRPVPILPVIGYRNALVMHDLHHTLTGYDTSFPGELELAAWELASGGCAWNLFFWIDRIIGLLIGLVAWPRRTLAAFRAGLRHRNLFGHSPRSILDLDYDGVRRMTRFDDPR